MKVLLDKCRGCRSCIEVCPVQAISEEDGKVVIDNEVCLGCGCCAAVCPAQAITHES